MREYVAIVRAILRGEPPPRGDEVADRLPRSAASARARSCRSTSRRSRPGCCALAGEIADGVILWLCNPRLHPRRRRPRGARRAASGRARRSRASTSSPRSRRRWSTTPPTRSPRCAATCSPTSALPFYRAMLERSGFGDDIAASTRPPRAATARRCRRRSPTRFLERADRGRRRRTPSAPGVAALPRRGRDVALRRPDPQDGLRGDAAGRGASGVRPRTAPGGAGHAGE